ncbi:MAG TPA: tetratricopeptide repeat protein [Steroidobacteraceae bacterium]|nr:tetratricopeptide repeat protein [Steroidobacteraceae bacterium]
MPAESALTPDEILTRAAELGPRDRAAYIRKACGADTALFQTVLDRISAAWLRELDEEPTFDGEIPAEPVTTHVPGERIGPYEILRVLGRGGMGEVYLCRRADEQYQKQVAIKLVSRGTLSRQVQTRLRTERQILATLDHPNIARLLDGGTTPEGVPYLVLEYIEGEPIDTYCDNHKLGITARLALFRVVCSAVQAAHRNLIVHRDLKPSNILVTAEGAPKLLDFGIAKLLDVRQTSHTIAMTQADIRIMTPDHASPEQIRGELVTTASDVYVLGVLLYELLCGQRPFHVAGLRFHEIERLICEQDPPPPSHAWTTMHTGRKELERIAEQRGSTPQRLRRQLSGDLDNIVMMAMRKEPERRYGSVERLSADIELYLRAMPVVARRDTWSYRARKFVTRHTLGVTLSVLFVLMLAAFAASMYVQAERLRDERDRTRAQFERAEAERNRAERVSGFLVDLFRRSDPWESGGENATALELLERGAQRIETELANDPDTQANLLDAIGRVYLARGETDKALPLLDRALRLRRELFGSEHVITASSMQSVGVARRYKGEFDQSRALLEDALRIQTQKLGENNEAVAVTLDELARWYRDVWELDTAEKTFRRSLAAFTAVDGPQSSQVANVTNELATLMLYKGEPVAAEQLYRQVLASDRTRLRADHPRLATETTNLAIALQMQGKLEEAEPLFKQSIESLERVLGREHFDTTSALSNYGWFLQVKGDMDGAEKVLRDVLALDQKVQGRTHPYVGHDMSNLADLLYERGQFEEAERLYRQAIDIYKATLPENHQYVAGALTGLARIFAEQGDSFRVEALTERAVAIWRKQFPDDYWQVERSRAVVGRSLVQQGKYTEAEPILLKSYAALEKQRGVNDSSTRQVGGWLVQLYEKWGKTEQAARYRAAQAGPPPGTAAN